MEDSTLNSENEVNKEVINGFTKLLHEFTRDLLNTFPELEETLDDSLREIHDNYIADNNDENGDSDGDSDGDGDTKTESISRDKVYKAGVNVFNYCNAVFPERFFADEVVSFSI